MLHVLLLDPTPPQAAPDPATVTLLHAARLLDVERGVLERDAWVSVRGGALAVGARSLCRPVVTR